LAENNKIPLKQRLAAKQLTIGSWLSFGYPQLAEMMANSGFDWLTVDMEHGAMGTAGMLNLIQVIELSGCVPLVRVGQNDARLIKTAMDAGAHGVIVPDVRSAEEAQRAVDALYYPPRGKRGVGLSRAQGFGMGFDHYRTKRVEEFVLIVQIEHYKAVENLDEILAIDDVDGFIIGPYDMSASLGLPGEFSHPDVAALLDSVEARVKTVSKPGGYHIVHSDHAAMRQRIDAGCRFMAYGTEMIFLAEKRETEGGFVSGLLETRA
jgi:2-dehydro-3-deoxyglucarate aldolase